MTDREKRCEDCGECKMKSGKMVCHEMWDRPCDELEECPNGYTLEEFNEFLEKSKNVKVDHGVGKTKKTETKRERKVDETKKALFGIVTSALDGVVENGTMKNEVEYSFDYKGERYTFKLTKHRPPKK